MIKAEKYNSKTEHQKINDENKKNKTIRK